MPENDCELQYPKTFPMSCMSAIIDIALKREAKTRLRELVLHSTSIMLYLTGVMLPENADDEVTPIGVDELDKAQLAACEDCAECLERLITVPQMIPDTPAFTLPILPLISLVIRLLRLYLKNRR